MDMEDKVKPTFVKASVKCVSVSLCLYLLLAQTVFAQEKLTVNQPVSRNIAAGATEKYSISLNDRDHAGVSFSQHSRVNLFILNPDGSVMRRLLGPSGDARNTFAFAAEGEGLRGALSAIRQRS